MNRIGQIFLGFVGVYIVAWVLLHLTLIAIESYDRFAIHREAGQRCLVWEHHPTP